MQYIIHTRCIGIPAKKLYIAALLCLLGVSCQEVGVVPDYMKPGRRDYVWTVDTLKIAHEDVVYPWRIWGAASNDVWLTCSGSPGTLWHFNGFNWTRDISQAIVPDAALGGTAANDIWLGGRGDMWHYNGVRWSKFSTLTPPAGYGLLSFNHIWGRTSNDVWAAGGVDRSDGSGGYKGFIMHFDGFSWQYKPIPDIRIGFSRIVQQASTGIYLLYGWRFEPTGDTCKVYSYDGVGELQQLYSDPETMAIESVRGEPYFISQSKIYKYRQGHLELWKDFSGTQYFAGMVGKSELDFFGQTRDNSIIHYNGTDLEVLFHSTVNIWLAYVVGDSAFFVCYDMDHNQTTIIRGRLAS